MSLVHNIVLTVGVADWGDGDPDENPGAGVARLRDWLLAQHNSPATHLVEISDHTTARETPGKACEVEIWAVGANYLDIEDFLQEFYAIEWNDPSEIVLIIAPQEGAHEVYRPKGALVFQRPYEKCANCDRYVYEADRTNNGANCASCDPDYED